MDRSKIRSGRVQTRTLSGIGYSLRNERHPGTAVRTNASPTDRPLLGPQSSWNSGMHGHNRTPFIGYHRVYVCQGPALRLRDRSDRVVRLTDIGAVSVVLTSWLYLSSALRKLIEVLIGIEDSLGLIYTCTAWHVILLNVSLAYIRQSDVRAAVVYQYRSVAGDHI